MVMVYPRTFGLGSELQWRYPPLRFSRVQTPSSVNTLKNFPFVFSGGKVIIVIGGDDNYKDVAEEQSSVLSRWARRKVSSQFDEQFLDGRKSFIFSWDREHKPIHEEAMLHFLDPEKEGETFVPKPVPVEPMVPQVDPNKVSLRCSLYTFKSRI